MVNRVECVQAVLTQSQQKEKGPIQYLDNLDAKDQFDLIRGSSNPGPDTGFVPSMRPDSVAQPNEVPITEASIPFQVVLISTQFRETSYPLKDPLGGENSKEALAAVPIPSPRWKNILLH